MLVKVGVALVLSLDERQDKLVDQPGGEESNDIDNEFINIFNEIATRVPWC